MPRAEKSRKIKVKKRGNALGFWFFKVALHLFGLKGAYGLLYFVCIHYLLFDRTAVFGALAYINRRFPKSNYLKRRLHVYRLFISQGKHLIDRYAYISKRQVFNFNLQGYDQLEPLLKDPGQGIVLLMSHVGNWQVAMVALKKMKKTVYMLMRPEDNQAVQSALQISSEDEHIKIISPEQYLGGVVEIMNALKEGNIVAMMGDREYGVNAIDVTFLGDKAWFPYSAFSIAAAAKCPIVILLSSKNSTYEYSVDVDKVMWPSYEKGKDKHQQLKHWTQEFTILLETYVNEHPYQCFLFHDVWKGEHSTD